MMISVGTENKTKESKWLAIGPHTNKPGKKRGEILCMEGAAKKKQKVGGPVESRLVRPVRWGPADEKDYS